MPKTLQYVKFTECNNTSKGRHYSFHIMVVELRNKNATNQTKMKNKICSWIWESHPGPLALQSKALSQGHRASADRYRHDIFKYRDIVVLCTTCFV